MNDGMSWWNKNVIEYLFCESTKHEGTLSGEHVSVSFVWFHVQTNETRSLSPCCESAPPPVAESARTGLTAAALSVLLQQLPFRTDAVVRARSAHTLVLTAVLHRVAQVHVCKHTGNASKHTCTRAQV